MRRISSEERERQELESFKRRVHRRLERVRDAEGRPTGEIREVVGLKTAVTPDHIMSRQRRCQNCQYWDQADKFSGRVKDHIIMNSVRLDQAGITGKKKEQKLARITVPLSSGEFGLCTVAERRVEEASEFVHWGYACSTWNGHITPDGKGEDNPGEIYEQIENKMTKK